MDKMFGANMTVAQKQQEVNQSAAAAIEGENRPVKITWKNLNYTVQVKKAQGRCKGSNMQEQKVIKDVSGFALPG